MKLLALLLGGLFLPCAVHAQTAHQWQPEHTVLAVTSSTAIAADWLLSVDAVRRNSYSEINPILGHRPSVGWLTTYNILAIGSNLAIGRLLPGALRGLWFSAVTGFEMAIVLHQYNIGLRFDVGGL